MTYEQIEKRLRRCVCGAVAINIGAHGTDPFIVRCAVGCKSRLEIRARGGRKIARAIAAWNVANASARTVARRALITTRRKRPAPLRTHAPAIIPNTRRTARGFLR